jgi:rubredoxin
MWEQNLIDLKSSWYILCFAYKWAGDKKVSTVALPDFKSFKRDREDDSRLVRALHRLYDEADVIIAHNGDRFDLKKSNARFVKHGLPPPSPYKSIDTLKIARSRFAFLSNKLNDLGAYLGLGRKLPHTGFHLWKSCMTGHAKAWRRMRAYNARDVILLERVYDRLKPWASSHPNLAAISERECCPVCQSHKIQQRGYNVAKTKKTQRWHCTSCGHWWSKALGRRATHS